MALCDVDNLGGAAAEGCCYFAGGGGGAEERKCHPWKQVWHIKRNCPNLKKDTGNNKNPPVKESRNQPTIKKF